MDFLVQSSSHLSRWDRAVKIIRSQISHAWAPVSTTPVANFATIFPSVIDTGGKFAAGVYDTGGK
jgi:hypothetical protein